MAEAHKCTFLELKKRLWDQCQQRSGGSEAWLIATVPTFAFPCVEVFFHQPTSAVYSFQNNHLESRYAFWYACVLWSFPKVPKVSGDGKVLLWDARDNDLSQPSRGAAVASWVGDRWLPELVDALRFHAARLQEENPWWKVHSLKNQTERVWW